MSGSERGEWDAYMKGIGNSQTFNFSYQTLTNQETANTDASTPMTPPSPNQHKGKQNQLPPLPSMPLVRGGTNKRKGMRSSLYRKRKTKPHPPRGKTHKKKRSY